ncbi:MAG: DUF2267 domain-containing protein [Planctomycetales bacterium]
MSATGLETFDSTLQTTNIWLAELMDELEWEDRHRAYHAFRVVLHALRDRLPVNETAHLAAQLPMLVRGIFFEGWHPAGKPLKERSREEFLAHIEKSYPFDFEADVENIARAVFSVLEKHVTPGEIDDVKQALPAPVRKLWP